MVGASGVPTERPVRVKLTGAEAAAFRALDWSAVAVQVLAPGVVSGDVRLEGDRVLAAFEAAVLR